MRVAAFDLEGPLSTQDNAYEVASLLPDGKRLFERLSRYDDRLALRGREGHEAGDTLSLVVPFLVAGEVTDEDVREVSSRARLVRGAPELVRHLSSDWAVYVISTSYRHHALAVASELGLGPGEVRCTSLDLEGLRSEVDEDFFELVGGRRGELLDADYEALDRFFFEELPDTGYGDPYERVEVVGGGRKAEALGEILEKEGVGIEGALVVGDSITDREMLGLASEGGGLSLVFNGNRYALEAGDYGIASTDLRLVRAFSDLDEPERVAGAWESRRDEFMRSPETVAGEFMPEDLPSVLRTLGRFPYVHRIGGNFDRLEEIHLRFREMVRGEAAKLG